MKNILITGNTSGLGYELDKLFRKTYNVFSISRSSINKNKNHLIYDFENINDLEGKITEFLNGIKNIETVFLNAGILGQIELSENITIDKYKKAFNINVFANKIIIDYLIKNVKVKNIIAISTGASVNPYHGWSLYCTTKASFRQMISIYALENSKTKFVNLAPGIIKTKMQEYIKSLDSAKHPSLTKFHSLYEDMDSPKIVARKILKNLDFITNQESGSYIDLRKIQ